jgi:hypothetical protein
MLHLLSSAAPAALLVALFVGLVPISRLSAGILTANASLQPRRTRPGTGSDFDTEAHWAENEFAFERAIECYEKLIDETARRPR